MKRIFSALGLALALLAVPALSACSTLSRLTSSESVATYDEKALITVELAYSFVLRTVNDAAAIGAIDQSTAAQILPVLVQTDTAVRRARALYDSGNAADAALATQDAVAQVAALTTLLQQLSILRRAGSPN